MELLRAPHALTAWGDPVAGALWSAAGADDVRPVLMSVLGALLVYGGGMILNDVADEHTDRQERPLRPLPSGRISRAQALAAGAAITIAGLAAFFAAGPSVFRWGAGLAALAALYNFALKRTGAGPLAMGGCRALSVLTGASAAGHISGGASLAALVIGGYVAVLSSAARHEMSGGRWTPTHTSRALGMIPLLQASLCATATPAGPARWIWSALLVLMLPLHSGLRRRQPSI